MLLVHKGQREIQVYLAKKVILDLLVRKDLKEKRVIQETLGHRAYKVQREILAMQVLKVLKETLAILDHKALKGTRETQARKDLKVMLVLPLQLPLV